MPSTYVSEPKWRAQHTSATTYDRQNQARSVPSYISIYASPNHQLDDETHTTFAVFTLSPTKNLISGVNEGAIFLGCLTQPNIHFPLSSRTLKSQQKLIVTIAGVFFVWQVLGPSAIASHGIAINTFVFLDRSSPYCQKALWNRPRWAYKHAIVYSLLSLAKMLEQNHDHESLH